VAGLFRLCLPRTLGGHEADPALLLQVIEEVARADGSTGWCVMIGATSGLVSAYLPDEAGREIYGAPGAVSGGVFAPVGQAVEVPGGYRVSGRWAFASGCQHWDWLMGGCVVATHSAPTGAELASAPDSRMVLFPAAEARIVDTWSVSGLCGTGSHDVEVPDLFVPATRSVALAVDRPRHPGPLYAFPVFGMLALGIAAVALGIGRSAIATLADLARAKTPTLSRRPLAARPATQGDLARAEALLRGGRAFLFEAVAEAMAEARSGVPITVERRATLRLAATHAVRSATAAVDIAYEAGGGSSIYAASLLQRCFRDTHAVTQHMMVTPATFELAGRVLLGIQTDVSML
jgi:alkylation response protein AidB-like acyl-CoA dehydrogenase